jgi:UDP-2-acetamido-2,6-beta-L-arabino-hexul-4-ose reductase
MRIVVTGSEGFIASNLRFRLAELGCADVVSLSRTSDRGAWLAALAEADMVVHLAGVNRPANVTEFQSGNVDLTAMVCAELERAGRGAAIVFSSSIQAGEDNPYGRSKRDAEHAILKYAEATGARACILRLPNVFGKWARPNYNSAVATFCYNISRGIPITVNDPAASLQLAHIDDVVNVVISLLPPSAATGRIDVTPVYDTTVGEVADMLYGFAMMRQTLSIPKVGTGLTRALYSTYVSYLPSNTFSYPLVRHEDARGTFSEMLRTSDSGQVSYFTAHPGVTRGEHYHHTKTEKFLVVVGRARFGFRNILSGETCSIDVDGVVPTVVDTVPGWAHNITNIGDEDLVVMLWANEGFDPDHPDTYASRVAQ